MSFTNVDKIPGNFKQTGSNGAENDLSDLPPLVPNQTYLSEQEEADILNNASSKNEKALVKHDGVGRGIPVGNVNGDKSLGRKRASTSTDEKSEHDAKRRMIASGSSASVNASTADEANAVEKADEAKAHGRKWTISELFSVVLVVIRVRALIEDIAEKAWEADRKEEKKHTPVTGKNVHFSWVNNTHVDSKPFVVGGTTRKNEVRLRLKADNGKFYVFRYHRKVDWEDSKSISKLNSWRRQIFRRCLNKEEDNNPSRPAWTIKEQKYLNSLIDYKKSFIHNGKLDKKDWDTISNAHNSKFQGKTLSQGEPLARSKVARGLSLPGQTLKKPKPLPARTVASMKNMVARWEGVNQNAVSSAVAPSGAVNAVGNAASNGTTSHKH